MPSIGIGQVRYSTSIYFPLQQQHLSPSVPGNSRRLKCLRQRGLSEMPMGHHLSQHVPHWSIAIIDENQVQNEDPGSELRAPAAFHRPGTLERHRYPARLPHSDCRPRSKAYTQDLSWTIQPLHSSHAERLRAGVLGSIACMQQIRQFTPPVFRRSPKCIHNCERHALLAVHSSFIRYLPNTSTTLRASNPMCPGPCSRGSEQASLVSSLRWMSTPPERVERSIETVPITTKPLHARDVLGR